jgi:Zn finger protein HypA/HybF involved in hydrogenase expression
MSLQRNGFHRNIKPVKVDIGQYNVFQKSHISALFALFGHGSSVDDQVAGELLHDLAVLVAGLVAN